MKDFVKITLAVITGLVVTGILFTVIGIFTIAGIAAAGSTQPTKVEKNSVLVLDLNGEVPQQSQTDPYSFLLGNDYESTGLNEILNAIDVARENENIEGIYLKADALSTTPATLQEIRDRLLKFKESGKFVVAYSDNYTQGCYYLCSVADKVLLNPSGSIAWTGLGSQILFYKDLLEKVGVEVQVFKVGDYKSAVEPYISNQMSDANREQTTEFLQSIWGEVTKAIAESRNLSVDSLNAYADRIAMLQATSEYVAQGFVDTLLYRSDVEPYLAQMMQLKKGKKPKLLSVEDVNNIASESKSSDNKIAIYYAEGGIDDSDEEDHEDIHGPQVCRELRELAEDDDIKAVVIRVNSPGGSAYASEQIWHEIEMLKAKKPVVVSMGGYAASGGYYISSGAQRIFAEPTTLTGSIGIFGMIPNFRKLAEEKLGIHSEVVNTNRHSDVGNMVRAFDQEERAAFQREIERGYQLFVKRCSDGRKMTTEEINAIAGGRVWTGAKALEIGLVDELGGLEDAIQWVVKNEKMKDYECVEYPEQLEFWQILLNEKDKAVRVSMREQLGEFYPSIETLRKIKEKSSIQARLPYDLHLNL